MKGRYTLFLFIAVLLAACKSEEGWDCTKPYGEKITEVRSPGAFHSLDTEGEMDIDYRYASTAQLKVVSGDNIINRITTDVRDSVLYIRNEESCKWVRDLSKRPKIIILAPSLKRMENRSVGDVVFIDTLRSPEFLYEQYDAGGTVSMTLDCTIANIYMHTGPTALTVKGRAGTAELYSATSGRLMAENFIVNAALVNNTSIQPIKCYAEEYLYAGINLSGDILYRGNPVQIDTVLTGTGELKPL
jgi:hypothetical protein